MKVIRENTQKTSLHKTQKVLWASIWYSRRLRAASVSSFSISLSCHSHYHLLTWDPSRSLTRKVTLWGLRAGWQFSRGRSNQQSWQVADRHIELLNEWEWDLRSPTRDASVPLQRMEVVGLASAATSLSLGIIVGRKVATVKCLVTPRQDNCLCGGGCTVRTDLTDQLDLFASKAENRINIQVP
jgi:hypothetical protein